MDLDGVSDSSLSSSPRRFDSRMSDHHHRPHKRSRYRDLDDPSESWTPSIADLDKYRDLEQNFENERNLRRQYERDLEVARRRHDAQRKQIKLDHRTKCDHLQDKIIKLMKRITVLEKQNDSSHREKDWENKNKSAVDALNGRLEEVKKQKEHLDAKCLQLTEDGRKTKATLEKRAEELLKEKERLKKDANCLQQNAHNSMQAYAKLDAKLCEANANVEIKQQTIEKQTAQIDALKSEVRAAKDERRKARDSFGEEIKRLEEEKKNIQEELEKKNALVQEGLETQLAINCNFNTETFVTNKKFLEKKLSEFAKLEPLLRSVANRERHLAKEYKVLQRNYRQLLDTYNEQCVSVHSQTHQSVEGYFLNHKINELNKTLEAKEEEVNKVSHDLHESHAREELMSEQLAVERSELRRKNEELNEMQTAYQKAKFDLQLVDERAADLQGRLDALQG